MSAQPEADQERCQRVRNAVTGGDGHLGQCQRVEPDQVPVEERRDQRRVDLVEV
jgi:hypothetical protein